MISTFVSYKHIAADIDRSLSQKAAERPVALETEYYLSKIGEVRTLEDFLKDTRLFRFAMKAFGLEEMENAKGFIRKILTDGVEDPKALANRLADDRFLEFAKVFDFAKGGEETTARSEVRQGVVDRYIRQSLEIGAGEENQGVRLALYFKRAAPEVSTAYGILGDEALWKVVQTVFGFPPEMANAAIENQAKAVEQRLNIADLKDPEKLDQLIQRFTAIWDATENVVADPILGLFSGETSPTMGLDLVMTLHNLKRGGA